MAQLPSSPFRSPEAVYQAFSDQARRARWQFSKGQWRALETDTPTGESGINRAYVIDMLLEGNLRTTFDALVGWCREVHDKVYVDPDIQLDLMETTYHPVYPSQPYIGWRALDLAANLHYRRTVAVPPQQRSTAAGLAVVAAAAQHPGWAHQLGWRAIPPVVIPGVVVRRVGHARSNRLITLSWTESAQLLVLSPLSARGVDYNRAYPEVVA